MSKKLLMVLAVALAIAAPAQAASDAKQVMQVVNHFVDAVNAGDMATGTAAFTASPSIIDEFPPYHWAGPSAFADWGAAFGADSKLHHITAPLMKLMKASHVSVEGDSAYAVVTAVYHFKRNGKSEREPGSFTFAMKREGGDWKIGAWSWTMK